MELAQGREQHDPGGLAHDAVLAQGPPDLLAQGGVPGMKVVAVVQGQGADAVVPEQGAVAGQRVKLVQIQGVHVQPVVKAVPDPVQTLVAQDTGIDPRMHQLLLKLAAAS